MSTKTPPINLRPKYALHTSDISICTIARRQLPWVYAMSYDKKGLHQPLVLSTRLGRCPRRQRWCTTASVIRFWFLGKSFSVIVIAYRQSSTGYDLEISLNVKESSESARRFHWESPRSARRYDWGKQKFRWQFYAFAESILHIVGEIRNLWTIFKVVAREVLSICITYDAILFQREPVFGARDSA